MRIPLDKFDKEALEGATKEDLLTHQKKLLEWIQDYNWPVAKTVAEAYKSYVYEIQDSLLEILRDEDIEWKVNVITGILYFSESIPPLIMDELNKIYDDSSEFEYVKEMCEEVFSKFGRGV